MLEMLPRRRLAEWEMAANCMKVSSGIIDLVEDDILPHKKRKRRKRRRRMVAG